MNYAITYPERVDRLILSNSMPATSTDLTSFIQEFTRRCEPYQEELARLHQSQGFREKAPDVIERIDRIIFRTYCYRPEKANELNLRMTQRACVNGQGVYENIIKNVFGVPFDLLSALKNITAPTLVLHGDYDPIPHSSAEKIHKSISESEYILMKNCGHFPFVEEPDLYFFYVRQFLQRDME